MWVKLIRPVQTESELYARAAVVDVPQPLARQWIDAGAAEPVAESSSGRQPLEDDQAHQDAAQRSPRAKRSRT